DGDIVFDAAAVEARYGVRPEQMVDWLCLVGDSVDNIPGVPGVGEKTAASLLQRYGTLEQLIARADELPKPKLRESLIAAASRLRTNRALIELHTNLPLPVSLGDLKIVRPDYTALIPRLKALGFKSLPAEVEKESSAGDDSVGR